MARASFRTMEPEKSRTEASQVGCPMGLRHARVHLREQANQKLVVPLGPSHPETHATKPEQDPFHMELFGRLTTRMRAFEKIGTTYHYPEEVVPETIFANMV
jgi:hypothetical protein